MSSVQQWFEQMQSIWLEKRPDDIGALLSSEFEYYETPFDPPFTNKDDVVKAWQEIKHQKIEFVKILTLYEEQNAGVAQWDFKMENESLHRGGYFLKLDNEGKCIEFRQWWNVK